MPSSSDLPITGNERGAVPLAERVARLLARPDSAAYAALLESVEEGNPDPIELARALLQVASALVQMAAMWGAFCPEGPRRPPGGPPWPDPAVARRQGSEERDQVAEIQGRLARAVWEAVAPAATRLPTLHQRRQTGQRVRVQEALDVATLLAQALIVLDLRPLGEVGEVTAYDPRQHVPRHKKDHPLEPGTTVQVDTVGYTYQDRVLRPAQVVPVERDK